MDPVSFDSTDSFDYNTFSLAPVREEQPSSPPQTAVETPSTTSSLDRFTAETTVYRLQEKEQLNPDVEYHIDRLCDSPVGNFIKDGIVFAEDGNYDAAIEQFQKALEKKVVFSSPEEFLLRHTYVELFVMKGNLVQACKELQASFPSVLRMANDFYVSSSFIAGELFFKGLSHLYLEEQEKGVEDIQTAAKEGYPTAVLFLKAIGQLPVVSQKEISEDLDLEEKARLAFAQGQYEKALEFIDAFIASQSYFTSLSFDYPDSATFRGACLAMLSRFNEAIGQFKGIFLDNICLDLALIEHLHGDKDAAKKHLATIRADEDEEIPADERLAAAVLLTKLP
jgi:tetratricopeptide (TPR) repeat protein